MNTKILKSLSKIECKDKKINFKKYRDVWTNNILMKKRNIENYKWNLKLNEHHLWKSLVYLKVVKENAIANDNADDYHITTTQRNTLICSLYLDSKTGLRNTNSEILKAESKS